MMKMMNPHMERILIACRIQAVNTWKSHDLYY